jgi:hypothetical protein
VDIVLVIDISPSMAAQDFRPLNRLNVAKETAREFVRQRPHDRIGLVGFAATAFTQCPLTLDHSALIELLDQLDFGLAEDGNEHAILGFDGETDVDGFGMDDFSADEAARGRAVFAEGDGERARGVEGGTGFARLLFAVREEGIEGHGQADGGERARPRATHGIGDGDAHAGSFALFVFVQA